MFLVAAAGASALVAGLLMLPGLVAGPSVDAAVFALVGRLTFEGRLPYLDAWDHKPPVVFLADGAAQRILPFLDPWTAPWLLSVLVVAGAGVVTAVVLRRAGLGWEAVVGGAAVSAGAGQYVVSLGGGMTESLAILPAAAAIWLALPRSAGAGRLAGAGALAALAVLTSIPALAVLAGLLVLVLRRSGAMRAVLWTIIGGVAVVVATVATAAATGTLTAAWDALVTYSSAFRALGAPASVGAQASAALLSLLFLLVPAALGALAAARSVEAAVRDLAVACEAWIGGGIVLFVAEARFETHYAAVIVVPLAMLAALGLRRTVQVASTSAGAVGPTVRLGEMGAMVLAWAPLAAGVLISATVIGSIAPAMVGSVAAETDRTRLVGQLAAGETDDAATIFVWGDEPQIYLWADRLPAGPYLYLYPLTTPGYSTDAQVVALTTWLASHPPALVIDAGSLVPGSVGAPPLLMARPVDTADPRTLDLLEPLRRLIAERYVLEDVVDGWPVYRLRAGSAG